MTTPSQSVPVTTDVIAATVNTPSSPTTGPLYTTGDKWQDKKKQTQVRYFNDLRSVQLRRINPGGPSLSSLDSSEVDNNNDNNDSVVVNNNP